MNSPTITLQDLSNLNLLISRIDTFCLAVQSLQASTPVRDLVSLSNTSHSIQEDLHEFYDNLEIQFDPLMTDFDYDDDNEEENEDDVQNIENFLSGETK